MGLSYEEKASHFDSLSRVFVRKDSPEITSVGVAPESVTLDLSTVNVKELRSQFLAQQKNFDTAPFDHNGALFRLYPGQVTAWSGYPGAGKTTLLRQFVCHLLQAGRSVFVASLEEHPRDFLWRTICTAAGAREPNDHQAQWFLDQHGERLRIWSVIGASAADDVLSAINALKPSHAVIDSLMALDISGYDWEAQRLFSKKLLGAARMSGAHIHLVAHPRKPAASDQMPDVHDIAGSADLGRLVDNALFVRRNSGEESVSGPSGMQILVRKQRHFTGGCPVFSGYFHREFLQFHTERFPSRAARYLPEDAYT